MTVLLYPGAGSDSSHPSLVATEQWLAPHRCVRADFPYRKSGRKAPDRAPVLLAAIRDELTALPTDEPLVMGGRSMGGRMCSMIAAGVVDVALSCGIESMSRVPLGSAARGDFCRPTPRSYRGHYELTSQF